MPSDTAAREALINALEAELVGPGGLVPVSTEELQLSPSRHYLTGFLAPDDAARGSNDIDDEEDLPGADDADTDEPRNNDPDVKKYTRRHPASMGLSVLVPPGAQELVARVSFADYDPFMQEQDEESGKKVRLWRRMPWGPFKSVIPLVSGQNTQEVGPEGAPLILETVVRDAPVPGLQPGTRAVTVFLVNRREPAKERGENDRAYAFQVALSLQCFAGFVARPHGYRGMGADSDDHTAELQYRHVRVYAGGHGVAASVAAREEGRVVRVEARWLPTSEVATVRHVNIPDVTLKMDALGALASAQDVRQALGALPKAYEAWLANQKRTQDGLTPEMENERDKLCDFGHQLLRRMQGGINLLCHKQDVLKAFCLANQAMAAQAKQLRKRPDHETSQGAQGTPKHVASAAHTDETFEPCWRLFQLAFLLCNLSAFDNPHSRERELVDLIFFPTGGGKTEAYLGVIAYLLVLRRLRGQRRRDAGLGTAVVLRYTLRLLTLDQLGRAATLICALEILRKQNPELLGNERFTIGMWVGQGASPNLLKKAVAEVEEYRDGRRDSGPCPLPTCPWCKKSLGPGSFESLPAQMRLVTYCLAHTCVFSGKNSPNEGIPLAYVDEQLYSEPPSMIIATVDKFAVLPWRGAAAKLFGVARGRLGTRILGFDEKARPDAFDLPEGLMPPELIIQDELHLITGPLGTMVGLYESAVDLLCSRTFLGYSGGPKIIASTATAKRAKEQVKALFGRKQFGLYPPPGVNIEDNFFSQTQAISVDAPGRLYLGVASSGRAFKNVLIRVYVALCSAASKLRPEGPFTAASIDGYLTLVGYFNSLRELGGMRRLVDDDVVSQLAARNSNALHRGKRPGRAGSDQRSELRLEELTSRESTARIAAIRARLAHPNNSQDALDVLLASNMLSVGVDVPRLGLMVVAGQPKTTSEYIQASSRVGRQKQVPGLVVTCLNVHKSRDRSHYEYFESYHQAFYRHVEAASLTPLSDPALRRGLLATWVACLRLASPELVANDGIAKVDVLRRAKEALLEPFVERIRARAQDGEDRADVVRRRLKSFFDRLIQDVEGSEQPEKHWVFSPWDDAPYGKSTAVTLLRPLSHNAIENEISGPTIQVVAPTSMREVEPTANLWVAKPAKKGTL